MSIELKAFLVALPLAIVMYGILNDIQVLHPDDEGDQGENWLIGIDCAKQIGLA